MAGPGQIRPFWNSGINQRGFLNEKYHVDARSMENRVALLITNISFRNYSNFPNSPDFLKREGAEKDEQAMFQLLTLLGYEVVRYTNLTGEEIKRALQEFSKLRKLTYTDSVFVVIMSHGELGYISGTGRKQKQDRFEIDEIYACLNNDNCPALLNKPKIVIIQACRGSEDGAVNVTDDVFDGSMQTDSLVHKEMDFASLRSSTPHCLSYRNPHYGSYFIQFFVEVFKSYYRQDHVYDLFKRVTHCFQDFPKQLPTTERDTLMKHFYLVPEKDLVGHQRLVPDRVCSGVAPMLVSDKGIKKKEDRFQ